MAAPTLAQTPTGAVVSGTASSITATFANPTSTDNQLIADFAYFNTSFSAMSDTAGNTWTQNAALGTLVGGATPWRAQQRYCKNVAGTSSHAVSITFTGTVSTTLIINELTGQDLTNPLDVSQSQWATGTTSHSSGTSAATDTADELVLGFCSGQFGSTFSQDTGYTENYDANVALGNGSATSQTKTLSATGTQSFNTTSSGSINAFCWLTTWRGAAGGATHDLEGDAVDTVTAAGALTTGIPLAGGAAVVATAAGALTTGIPLAGSAASVAVATGDLTAQIRLAGAALAAASAGGDLTAQIRLAGAALAVALAQGGLTTGIPLAGAAGGVATAAGELQDADALEGAMQSVSIATGVLSTDIPLLGVAASVTTGEGALTVEIRLSGAAVAQAIAQGGLTTQIRLDGAALARAAMTGLLADVTQPVIDPRFAVAANERQFAMRARGRGFAVQAQGRRWRAVA